MACSVETLGKTVQLLPHVQSREATSLGVPDSTEIIALKADVASWWLSRRPPASVIKATLGQDVKELTCFTKKEIEGTFW